MSVEQVMDAEVVPDGDVEQPSVALARRERRSEVLKPLDPEQLLSSFAEYQGLLQKLLTPDDWQGVPNRNGSFVKKKGWRKIATAFDLDVVRVLESVERDEHGQPVRAEAVYRAIAPSGRSMDGDGYCSVDEPRFKDENGRQKLENDLRTTATTRAKNRAISDLIGLGDISAEEITDAPAAPAWPFYGPAASDGYLKQTRAAIAYVLDGPGDQAALNRVGEFLAKALPDGAEKPPGLPLAAAIGILGLAAELKEQRDVLPEAGA